MVVKEHRTSTIQNYSGHSKKFCIESESKKRLFEAIFISVCLSKGLVCKRVCQFLLIRFPNGRSRAYACLCPYRIMFGGNFRFSFKFFTQTNSC